MVAFWLSISTHINSEALNLISTFNLMLIVNNVQNTLQVEVDMCRIEMCTIEMLFLTCTEHTSTVLPVSETQDYDYLIQVKGTDQTWSFRFDV